MTRATPRGKGESVAATTKLGEALVAEGVIDDLQLRAALGEQARWGNRLGETLVRMGFASESEVVRVLGRLLQVPVADLEGKAIEPELIDLVPQPMAEKLHCIPLFLKRQGGVELLYLGMDDPTNLSAIDEVSFRTGRGVRPVLVGPVQLRQAVAAYYHGEEIPALREREIAEAPVVPGDTAPVFEGTELDDAGSWEFEENLEPTDPTAPAERAESDAEVPADAVVAEAPGDPATTTAGTAPPPAGKPRDVPTRQILQAVTRLLVERGILSREELLQEIRTVQREMEAGPRREPPGA
jgi:hypothetical protein